MRVNSNNLLCYFTIVVISVITVTNVHVPSVFANPEALDLKNDLSTYNVYQNTIFIDGESDLDYYDFPGSGSKEDPFRIENLCFNGTSFISIKNLAGFHFLVRNCTFHSHSGISFSDLYNGSITIVNNTILDCSDMGISIFYSDSITILNNTIRNSPIGIYSIGCNYVEISGNHLTNTKSVSIYDSGIRLYSNWFSKIANNTITGWINGVTISYTLYLQCYNNTIASSSGATACIDLYSVKHSSFISNSILGNNTENGILLEYSSQNRFIFNTIQNCSSFAISIVNYNSIANSIHHNNFLNNNANSSQCFDFGFDNVWYDDQLNQGNFWSDWTGSGNYSIDNDTADFYPLTNLQFINWSEIVIPEFMQDDYLEENDDFQYAKPISQNTIYNLISIDSDYFQLFAQRFYFLNITILTASANHLVDVSIYADNEALIQDESNLAVKDELISQCSYTGNYFIRISNANFQFTNYSLLVTSSLGNPEDDHFEENDNILESYLLSDLNHTYQLVYTDFDYFFLEIEENTLLEVELLIDSSFVDLDLYLLPKDFSGNQNEILAQSITQNKQEIISYSTKEAAELILFVRNTAPDGLASFITNYSLTISIQDVTLQFRAINIFLSLFILVIPTVIVKRRD